MNTLRLNGIELSYRDTGSGITLVMLHAFPLNQTMWDDQVPSLTSKFRVITLDWRGFGNSTLGNEATTLDSFADDVTGLLDHLEIDKAVICGLSMGGYASFALLRKQPERFAGLILADTRATRDKDEARQARFQMADAVRAGGTMEIADTMTERLLGAGSLTHNPALIKRVSDIILSNRPEGIAQALIAMADRPDSTGLLAEIDFPSLVICGEEDKLTPPDEAEKMSEAIPGSKLVIIKNAGHLPNLEQPEAFNSELSNFLEKF